MDDLTTHQSGHMQASAANGFMTTSSADCSARRSTSRPEYNTAKAGNISPWGAGLEDISTEFETGHWEACTSLADPIANTLDPNDNSPTYNECEGPYKNAGPADSNTPETGDSPCYYAGATHPGYHGAGLTDFGQDKQYGKDQFALCSVTRSPSARCTPTRARRSSELTAPNGPPAVTAGGPFSGVHQTSGGCWINHQITRFCSTSW
jgi:hypothetical protein